MSKVIRLFNTLIHLKPVQLAYQLRYRIFGYYLPPERKKAKVCGENAVRLMIPELDCDAAYAGRFRPEEILGNRLVLLHRKVEWHPGKWQFEEESHLWNFNLHYMEYGVALGACFKMRGETAYYDKFRELYTDWMESNPCGRGDGWHPYTVSLRMTNLMICMELFAEALRKDEVFAGLLRRSIYNQFRFLLYNPEKNLLGNHYFENLKAVYLAALLFRDDKIRRRYAQKLTREIGEQILPDGMHVERSFLYHRLILEDVLRLFSAELRSGSCDRKFAAVLEESIQEMGDCMYSLEEGMGKMPLFNDSGEGVAKERERLHKAANRLTGWTPSPADAFPDAGYYKLHGRDCAVLIDCGPVGPDYMPGHAHCDALSFELSLSGKPVFVNSGTFQYQGRDRAYFRSTRAHNTVQVGEREQSECWGEHRVGRRIRRVSGAVRQSGTAFEGSYEGYGGEKVSRRIELRGEEIRIEDRVTGSLGEEVRCFFHLHPECACRVEENGRTAYIEVPGRERRLVFHAGQAKMRLHEKDELSQYSQEFGEKTYGPTMELRWDEAAAGCRCVMNVEA